ncbi:hypothetical protein JRQ81_010737 [Phrynocephalus forsythii]|uniref:Uncharacterized protein n=1 Tax=Phrynocephalus forsythii TaxID=171643 RepID=A0A9Q0X919_9SAUR|nr:hypothetical protein JRQ81_010737 [Phrynocephalus forsythii]
MSQYGDSVAVLPKATLGLKTVGRLSDIKITFCLMDNPTQIQFRAQKLKKEEEGRGNCILTISTCTTRTSKLSGNLVPVFPLVSSCVVFLLRIQGTPICMGH